MRATEVKHTPLKVDLTDPSVNLQGDGNGQSINHAARLRAVASDPLSGMASTGEFPGDEPPAVIIEYAGSTDEARNTDTNDYEIDDEGTHQMRYWARDLAGNASQPETRTIRIDKTDPAVAFTNAQDPDDPDKLVAPVERCAQRRARGPDLLPPGRRRGVEGPRYGAHGRRAGCPGRLG